MKGGLKYIGFFEEGVEGEKGYVMKGKDRGSRWEKRGEKEKW